MARLEICGLTVWRSGECCSIVGMDDGRVGVVAVGRCGVPRGVGAVSGGKLSRVAKKLAKAKALRRVAAAALRKANDANPANALSAVRMASTALDAAKRLEREARTDTGPDDEPDQLEDQDQREAYDDDD